MYGPIAEEAAGRHSIAGYNEAELSTVVGIDVAAHVEAAQYACTTCDSERASGGAGGSVAAEHVDVATEVADLTANVDVTTYANTTDDYHATRCGGGAYSISIAEPDVAKRGTAVDDARIELDVVANIDVARSHVGNVDQSTCAVVVTKERMVETCCLTWIGRVVVIVEQQASILAVVHYERSATGADTQFDHRVNDGQCLRVDHEAVASKREVTCYG